MKKIVKVKKTVKKAAPRKHPVRVKRVKKAKPAAARIVKTGLSNIFAPHGAHKGRKYLGRGSSSGHGKTSTRGSKGQTSRAGRHFYLGFEGGQSPLIRKIPKRGFTNIFRKVYQLVNLKDLSRVEELSITPELLKKEGLIKDQNKPVKILGDGDIKGALTVRVHAVSKSAGEKIKAAGGNVEIIVSNA